MRERQMNEGQGRQKMFEREMRKPRAPIRRRFFPQIEISGCAGVDITKISTYRAAEKTLLKTR